MPNSIELLPDFIDLPSDVQDVIRNFEYDEALKGVQERHKLHIDQAACLEKETAKVIFGEARSHELIQNIQRELRITHEKAQEITIDVNNTILRPLQTSLKTMQTSGEDTKPNTPNI